MADSRLTTTPRDQTSGDDRDRYMRWMRVLGEIGGRRELAAAIVAWTNDDPAAKFVTDEPLGIPYWNATIRRKALRWMLKRPGFVLALLAQNLGTVSNGQANSGER